MLQTSDIHALRQVAELGSVNRACEVLGMSQSTLSKLILRMEDRLKCTLFERSGRGMTPTSVCTFIIESGAGIEAKVAKIERQAALMGEGKTGTINLGVGPIVEDIMLADVLSAFTTQFPDVVIDVRTDREDRLLSALERDVLDVAVGPFDEAVEKRGFRMVSLISQEILSVVRPIHPLADQKEVTLEEYLSHKRAGPHLPVSIGRQFRKGLSERTFAEGHTILCEDYGTVKKIAQKSDVIISGPEPLFAEELKTGSLVPLSFDLNVRWQCGFVAKPESLYAKPVEFLVSLFKDHCDQM